MARTLSNTRSTESELIDYTQIRRILRRWWWLLAIVIALVIGMAYAALDRVEPRYNATATVVVSPKTPQVLADMKEFMELPGGTRRQFSDYIRTQLDIIKSQKVASEVLDRMDLWDDARLFGEYTPVERSRQASMTGEELRKERATSLAARINTERVSDSLIIQIQFQHKDPVLAAGIANTVAAVYESQNLALKREVLEKAKVDLQRLLTEREAAKLTAEKQVADFEQLHNITAVGTRRKEVQGERSFYNERVLEAKSRLVRAESELAQIRRARREAKGIFGIGAAEVLSNPVLGTLKLDYTRIRNEVHEYELVYGPKHFKLKGAKRRLRQVKNAVNKEIDGIYGAAQAKASAARAELKKLGASFDAARAEDDQLASAVETYATLTKELREQTALYDRIRKRHEEASITNSLASNNVRLLDSALVPTHAVWPRRGMVLAGSVVLGLFLGILLVLIVERADTTLRDKEHAEQVLQVPCLGLIPTISTGGRPPTTASLRERDLYVQEHPLSEAAEHARTLRTNLLFLSAERKLKTLLVTSALPEDGKTTIAIQIGITLASAGERVVLIEADLRRPRVGTTLQVRTDVGLSTYLADREALVSDILQETEVPNLSTIVCGLVPPNPAELLNSLRLNQLIARLHEQFDMVIIDSPPVNAVSDSMVMASRVDGVLLVAKARQTTTEAIRVAYRSLCDVDAPVIGTVLNAVQDGAFRYYRKGKYYRRGYYRRTPEELEAQDQQQSLLG
ncbi:MAG: polysaccharide biosynthesis tyrosine autokinase [Myxococcota bacterium]|nr:polysaccharide biosynthesis tyrosine autokinase [Myxococcota bacterium]